MQTQKYITLLDEELQNMLRLHNRWARDKTIDAQQLNLTNICFTKNNVRLHSRNFKSAILQNCDFSYCDLRYSNFECCNLSNSKFFFALLNHANFKNANIQFCDFTQAHLDKARMTANYMLVKDNWRQ